VHVRIYMYVWCMYYACLLYVRTYLWMCVCVFVYEYMDGYM